MNEKLFKITPTVQNYHWGKTGLDSAFFGYLDGGDPNIPYAELWIGAHPSSPATLVGGEGDLKSLIESRTQLLLGRDITEKWGSLPFLLKILSIGSPLSIQAHPNKSFAEILHSERGYPDDNHKPEMAVALTPVELLYGFRPVVQVQESLRECPEFEVFLEVEYQTFIENASPQEEWLKSIFVSLLEAEESQVHIASEALLSRLRNKTARSRSERWMMELLSTTYPDGDVGVFCFALMNLVTLTPGESVFIGPNIPHAYLSGDLIECMANSDNVVRAGLTPKEKDVASLIEMLEFKETEVLRPQCSERRVSGITETRFDVRLRQTPAPEFELLKWEGTSEGAFVLEDLNSPRVLLVIEGTVQLSLNDEKITLRKGEAAFLSASSGDVLGEFEDGVMFGALCPVFA